MSNTKKLLLICQVREADALYYLEEKAGQGFMVQGDIQTRNTLEYKWS